MTNKNRYTMLLAAVLLTAAVFTSGAAEWKSTEIDGFKLQWMVDGASLNVKLSAPTEGWLAVGFDPTNKMKDANIIIGYVDGSTVTIEDHFGNSQFTHRVDTAGGGTDNLANKTGIQSAGSTELGFTIPLDSGDANDRPLVAGRSYKVIFAMHTQDRITLKHTRRTSTTITL